MDFKMSSAICLNLDQSKTLSSGNGLTMPIKVKFHSQQIVDLFQSKKVEFPQTPRLQPQA